MNLDQDLNERQREAVTHGDGPLLVLAGPGTGKTRVITYRVAHLIQSGRAEPGQILALTFTNKSAQELMDRVHGVLGEGVGNEVWVGTFHNTCARILREDADALGLNADFAIFDQEDQRSVLAESLMHAGLDADPAGIARLRNIISLKKVSLRDPLDDEMVLPDGDTVELDPRTLARLKEAIAEYTRRLDSHGGLDFDDLLALAVTRFREHEEVRDRYRRHFRHVLVDEYQDINSIQYDFLRELTEEPYRLTAVGDEDQSIYSWRGSSVEWTRRYRDEFAPEVIELEQHYRSTRTILHAAAELIARNARVRGTPLRTNNNPGGPAYLYRVEDEDAAARVTVNLIRKLRSEAHVAHHDIAIFYRNHRQADLLEQHLAQARIPVQRVMPAHLALDADEARLLAWLRYLLFGLDAQLAHALTFPTPLLDEWTRVWFEWRARDEGRSFGEIVGDPGDDTPPLTRVMLDRTLRRMHELRDRFRTMGATEGARALVDELELHRSPFHGADVEHLRPWDAFPHLENAADVLHAALRREECPSIVSDEEMDHVAAACVLQGVVSAYFGLEAPHTVCRSGETVELSGDGLAVLIGDVRTPETPASRVIRIHAPDSALCPRAADDDPQLAAWIVYRLCQLVLALAEEPDGADVVVYDLETTGNRPQRAEIIEFAGTRLGRTEEHEHLYVKPKRSIPEFLTRIHKIDDATVRDKPPIDVQIKRISAFLGDAILVGHNIVEFDNRVLARETEAHLRKNLPNPSYDTLVVARRLFPHDNHRLAALAQKFEIPYPTQHQADHDVEVTKRVFERLHHEECSRRARTSLPEYLPFVALGAIAQNQWEDDAMAPYKSATARWLDARTVQRGVLDSLPPSHRGEARRLLERARQSVPLDSDDERRWQELRSRFLRRVVRFEELSPGGRLRDFLNTQALAEPIDDLDGSQDAVTMMTLHSAKGTEYRAVIMTAMEDGILPAYRSLKRPDRLAEERRLCYVGITRARERLYFVSARRRDGMEREVSRFIEEIPSNLLRRWSARR